MEPQVNTPSSISNVPFVTSFFTCQLDSNLVHDLNGQYDPSYYITSLRVGKSQEFKELECQRQQINEQLSLFISRNPNQFPIMQIANLDNVPDGWTHIMTFENSQENEQKLSLCYRNGKPGNSENGIVSIQLIECSEEEKSQELTQPSLSQKFQLGTSYVKIRIETICRYINVKKSVIQYSNLRFKPKLTVLFEKSDEKIQMQTMGGFCFPDGVRIMSNQSGFKFFSFIITNDKAVRYYCTSIKFSQKCHTQIQDRIFQKYGLQSAKGFYPQKTFTIISKFMCTDYVNRVLEQIYRVYLSQGQDIFKQTIKSLQTQFYMDLHSNRVKFLSKQVPIDFKLNSSYDHISHPAIYAVFKFLQIQKIIAVIQNLLLERKVFFVSDCQNLLGMAIQAFLSFIYPLDWVHGIINPLNKNNIEFSEAPLTIIYGISSAFNEQFPINVEGVFVFLDKNKVQFRKCQKIMLPEDLRKKYIRKLGQFSVYDPIDIREYLHNPENLSMFKAQKQEDPHFDSYLIRNILFSLIAQLLANYDKSFRKQGNGKFQKKKGIQKYYDVHQFIRNCQHSSKSQFVKRFVETSLFTVLIDKKKFQPNNKWIRTLDKAIRKPKSDRTFFIKQESDSEKSQLEQLEKEFNSPTKCIANLFSRQSGSEKQSDSSPSPVRQVQSLQNSTDKQSGQVIVKGRLSMPNQYEIRLRSGNKGQTSLQKHQSQEQKKRASRLDSESQKQSNSTDQQSEGWEKSSIQGKQQKDEKQIDRFEIEDEKEKPKLGGRICSFLSFPQRKIGSVVEKWMKKKNKKLNFWASNRKTNDVEHEKQKEKSVEVKLEKKEEKNGQARVDGQVGQENQEKTEQ